MQEKDILFTKANLFITNSQIGGFKWGGFLVWENNSTHSKLVSRVGYKGSLGFDRAKEEIERRLKDRFQVVCIGKSGKETTMFYGETFTEKEADNIVKSFKGGIGEQVGNRYVARKLA